MKLSDAIRIGAMLKPQGIAYLLTSDGKSCALGAALDAFGQLEAHMADEDYTLLRQRWPVLNECVDLPMYVASPVQLYSAIETLNDNYGWTRERIADWVATIEAQKEASAELVEITP